MGLCQIAAFLGIFLCAPPPPAPPPPPAQRGYAGPAPTRGELFVDVADMTSTCPPAGSKLVIGVGCFEDVAVMHPFIRSWRMHSPHTHIVLFSNNPSMRRALHDPQGSLVHVVMVRDRPGPAHRGEPQVSWNGWRLFLHLHFLESCLLLTPPPHGLPSGIMLSDTRDAIALGNVWQHPLVMQAVTHNYVLFSLEGTPGSAGNLTIAQQPVNARWIHACFGGMVPDEALQHVLQSPVSCSGVTVGGGAAMLAYARVMVQTALEVASDACLLDSDGTDQGLHNYVVHWSLPTHPNRTFRAVNLVNGESPIFNAGLGGEVVMDAYGVLHVPLTVPHGSTHDQHNSKYYPPYLHQFNRLLEVAPRIAQLYNKAEGGLLHDRPGW